MVIAYGSQEHFVTKATGSLSSFGGGGGVYFLIGVVTDFVFHLLGQGTSLQGGVAIASGILEHFVYGRILYWRFCVLKCM